MIKKPRLAKCSDRTIQPRKNDYCGNPENWFEPQYLEGFGLVSITFDFFVDWSSNPTSLSDEFWLKAPVDESIERYKLGDILIQELIQAYNEENIRSYIRFSKRCNRIPVVIVFEDDSDWSNSNPALLYAILDEDSSNELTVNISEIHKTDLMSKIRNLSGGAIRIGSKGLIYGTSRLECFLSKTDSLYPGDADVVLVDTNGNPRCIIELKKHNMASSISNQKLSNYYPRPDGRKYDRLEVLRKAVCPTDSSLPITVLYYPTRANEKQGKMELLKGNQGSLETLASALFYLPNKDVSEEIVQVIDKLMKGVEHYKQKIND
jgi:hypothetical protein